MSKPNKKLINDVTKALVRMMLADNGLQLSLDLPGVPQLDTKLAAAGVHVDDADLLAGILDGMMSVEVKRKIAGSYKVGLAVGRAVRVQTKKGSGR